MNMASDDRIDKLESKIEDFVERISYLENSNTRLAQRIFNLECELEEARKHTNWLVRTTHEEKRELKREIDACLNAILLLDDRIGKESENTHEKENTQESVSLKRDQNPNAKTDI